MQTNSIHTLQSLDDERRRRRDDGHLSLTVLHRQLDGDTETLPVARRLRDVLTDLLGGLLIVSNWFFDQACNTYQTQRADLGGKRRGSADLTTGGTEVDDLHFVRVDLRRHGEVLW